MDDKKFVIFIRNSAAESNAYVKGAIKAFSPKICAELISTRAAEYFTPPEKEAREVATLPKTETASKPPPVIPQPKPFTVTNKPKSNPAIPSKKKAKR